MTSTTQSTSAKPKRALMPDYLRLAALFGIVVVNVQYMAFPIEQGFPGATLQTAADDVAAWLVNGLALLKTYGLFSFMFGVGLAFQIRSAERRGLPFGQIYRNRMIGLVLLGIAHGVLCFPGDILVIYAVTGAVLYRWRDWPVRRLVKAGIALMVIQILIAAALTALTPAPDAELAAIERDVITNGTVGEVLSFRSISFAIVFVFGLFYQGIAALAWFCLGLAAVKHGMIDDPGHALWLRARRYCLLPGVGLSLAAAALWQWGDSLAAEIAVVAIAPLATLGYLGLIAAIARPPAPWLQRALTAGASSLSIYLGQSIVLSFVFAPYGLGLWDKIGPAASVVLAIGVTVALIGLLVLWRQRFALGPFEWILRKITMWRVHA